MSLSFEDFLWQRSKGGYAWQDGDPLLPNEGEPALTDRQFLMPRDWEAAVQLTAPLVSHPTLFRTFAALTPGEATFAAFAGDYGLLGVGWSLRRPGLPLHQTVGEPFSRWVDEWQQVRIVVHLLDAVQALDTTRLEQCVILHEDHADLYVELPDEGTVFSPHFAGRERGVLWQCAFGAPTRTERLARLARGWLQQHINSRLDPQHHRGEGAVPARILFDPKTQRFQLHLVPRTLIAAIWFQCARAFTEQPDFKQCERPGCGQWFERSADERRRHSKYCSARCKVAAYRLRKEQKRTPTKSTTTRRTQRHGKTTRQR
jgi:hypothetical protein